LLGLGLKVPIDLIDPFLQKRTKEPAPHRQQGLAKVLFPLQQALGLIPQERLEEPLDFFLECRL
jgi:hypothetical protein